MSDSIDLIDLGKKVKKKLYEGMILKNKQELFRTLGLIKDGTMLNGNQRKHVEEELSTYCEYSKYKGNQIIINKIYQEPNTSKRDETKVKNIYMKHIEALLLNYILKNSKGSTYINISYSGLFTVLGMNNDYYKNIRTFLNALSDSDYRVTNWELENFIIRSYSIMKTITNRTLDKLSNKSLIHVSKVVMIIDEFEESHIASDKEISEILKVENKVMNEMGFKDKSELFIRSKLERYYDKVKAVLKKEFKWTNYYSCLHIVKGSELSLSRALTNAKSELHRLALNEKIVESVDHDADKRYDNQDKKILEEWNNRTEDSPGLYSTFEVFKDLNPHYPEDYTDVQKKLSKFFLSINPSDYQELVEIIKEHNKKIKEKNLVQNG